METLLQGNTMPLVDRKKHDLSRATKAKMKTSKVATPMPAMTQYHTQNEPYVIITSHPDVDHNESS